MKVTRKDDKAVYSHSQAVPIHPKENLIVGLALMHKYGIITAVPFDKFHICLEETQRKNTSSCGSQENQQSDCR